MRIGFVAPYIPDRSTIAKYTHELVKEVEKLVDDVFIITDRTRAKVNLTSHEKKVYRILDSKNPLTYLQAKKVIKELHLDLLHVQDFRFFMPWLRPLIRKLNLVVITSHEVMINRERGGLVRLYADQSRLIEPFIKYSFYAYEREVYKYAQKIIVHNDILKDRLISCYGIPETKISVIPYGVNVNACPKYDYSIRNRLLFFGYLTPSKGLDLLIKAFELVCEEEPYVKLTIIGPPPSLMKRRWYGDLIRQIKESNVKNNVEMRGFLEIKEAEKYFLESDMLILPYRDVSHSSVAALTMAYGVPIIATEVGGFKKQIENRKTGLLVEPGSVDALSEAILELLHNDSLRERIGRHSRKYAQDELSWNEIAKKHVDLYNEMLNLT